MQDNEKILPCQAQTMSKLSSWQIQTWKVNLNSAFKMYRCKFGPQVVLGTVLWWEMFNAGFNPSVLLMYLLNISILKIHIDNSDHMGRGSGSLFHQLTIELMDCTIDVLTISGATKHKKWPQLTLVTSWSHPSL